MDGVLVLDKPAGMTSHDVVDAVRRRLHTRRVGHAGTLDPLATGLLVVGVGRATRFLSYAQGGPKRYRAEATFGRATDTHDSSGRETSRGSPDFTRDDLEQVLTRFTGEIEQVPPMVSAVRVGGERLYEKARRGEDVERAARPVTVLELTLLDLAAAAGEVTASLDVLCSAGTYVRTLIHDIGAAVGCGAHMSALRRTETGGFTLDDAVPLERAGADSVRPLIDVVSGLARVDIEEPDAAAVRHGRAIPAPSGLDHGSVVAVAAAGELVGVCRVAEGRLQPERVVAA